MKVCVVIPVGANRMENLAAVMDCLRKQTRLPDAVVLVADGDPDAVLGPYGDWPFVVATSIAPKHHPGREQPRNLGVRLACEISDFTHVWFLDSDVIVEPDCLEEYQRALETNPEPRILVGPYDWLDPGIRAPDHDLHNDPRQPSFKDADPAKVYREDLSAGLACFSGNLIWPIEAFTRIGGFWNELHHGRCEDGELGLRAVAVGIGISFVPKARGWHLFHDRDYNWIIMANARDVPMLNARHPWVEGEGLFVVEEDGKRFNSRCAVCGEEFNTLSIWEHQETCGGQK